MKEILTDMFRPRNLFFGCCLVLAVFQFVECTRHCRRNEVYVKCVNRCNNCVSRGHCSQITACDPGCDCKRGYYRNREGLCVPEKECDEPGNLPCRDDEEYRECSCVRSCCNRGDPEACSKQCLSGCFCREGLVRDQFGDCIKLEDCQTTETPSNCTGDEQFYKNKPDCKNTCENYDNAAVLCLIGKPGCFCKEGLVKRKDGKCVEPEECFIGKCRKNEQYYKYKPDCKNTCENYNNPGIRCARGNPGCFCKPGLVKRNDGKCVRPEKCSEGDCREDEQYYENKPDCKNTCQNYNNPGVRCASGKPGCFCKEGLVKRRDGKCVKPEECPGANRCSKRGEVFMKCGPPCGDEGCRPYRIGRRCTKRCKAGCFCKKGLVRDSEGNCVERSECDNKKCDTNEEHQTCGTACQPTCDNQNPICTRECKDGCFCKTGFIRDKEGGKCIPVDQCPTDNTNRCSKRGEVFMKCGPPCGDESCLPYRIGIRCLKKCKPGCFCKRGLVRDSKGNCVKRSECDNKICGTNEEHQICGTACQPTCNNQNPICTEECKDGCFCKTDFIREKEGGKCIPVEQCPTDVPEKCGKNEEYKTCGGCQGTCDIPDPFCTKECKRGCYCKEGYIRKEEGGKCIPVTKCPNGRCPYGEEYLECGSRCPATCDNYGEQRICTADCVAGCFCKKGMVRNKEGKCVVPEMCGKEVCYRDEQFETCGTACPDTCDNYGRPRVCTLQCVQGCFCKAGLVRRDDFRCVTPERCNKRKCNKDEVYKKCGTACPKTCANYGKRRRCTKNCVSGCFCRNGLVRDLFTKKCIPPEQCEKDRPCPKIACNTKAGCYLDRNAKPCPKCVCPGEPGTSGDGCGKNEEYKSCGTCQPTCDNRNPICTLQCRQGCYCKSGFIRERSRGDCIPIRKCPKGSSCPKIECNKKDGCYLDRKAKPCPKCVCPIEPVEECNADEVKKTCGSACPETCENYGKPRSCTEECVDGCFCKDGLVRDTNSKKCIPPEECKQRPICGTNEEIVDCAKPKWCNTCGIRGNCKLSNCTQGCDCKIGFYRDENGVCIPESECPSTSSCGVNEEIVDCAKPKWCNTCKIKGNCKLSSCTKGCDCKKGFYRDDNGVCIPKSKCPSSRPCPKINCNRRRGCYLNRNAKPCPKCVCPNSPGGPQCSPPKCKKGCRIDYSTKPCPSCKCDGFPGGPQCSPPKCAKGCRIDYSTKPCPSCKCDEFPGGPQCSPPKCARGCKIDYSTKPCPSCKCDEFPGGPQCSPPKCARGCRIDYSTKPCPSCKCNGIPEGPQCSLPRCEEGCSIDYSTKPCPSCKCDVFPGGPQCDIPKCDDGCTIDDSTKPCPSCKCDTLPQGPQCDIPKCVDGCIIDYSTQPCPSCKCDTLPGGPECSIPKCDEGCNIDYSTKPCPSCKCEPEILCDKPICDEPGCKIDYSAKPCPTCKCDEKPPSEVCGKDEEFVECVPCGNTCETYEQRLYCKPACRPGCTCKEGLVKSKDGKCVSPEQCDKDSEPPTEVCGKDEEYVQCVPCGNTCEDYEIRPVCFPNCRPGCTCKGDLVKRKDGKCVPTTECERDSECGRNEVYSTCVNPCNDCQTKGNCNFLVCNEGCDCKKGYYRNEKGKCIPEKQCPKEAEPPKCGKDEEYYECIPSCKGYCETYNKNIACKMACKAGCFCKKGLVKRKDGKCVKPKQCFSEVCGRNEVYSTCVNPCNDCQTRGKCNFLVCNEGCDCRKKFHRNAQGECIPAWRCPKDKCGPDEQYYECKPSCTNRCNPPDACAQVCIPGCFCREGLVLRDDGKCVKKDQCEAVEPTCGKDEQYYDCKPDCQNTCKAYRKNVPCPKICSPGCFCKEGLVKREDGKCVKPEQCNNEQCKPDEEYYRCKPFCANRCNPLKICPRICISGCFCRKGLVQRDDGKCVNKTECEEKPLCKKDEQYYDCTPDCTNTCETYGRPDVACPAICKQGCFCKKGLVKRKDGKCVRPNDCGKIEPPTEVCGKDEEYVECVPCGNTCENYEIRQVCRPICKPGCTCKGDLVKRKDGKCVPTTECEARECPLIKCPGDCFYDRFHKPCPRCLCHNKPEDNPAEGDNGDDDGGDEGNEGNGGSDTSNGDDNNYDDDEGNTEGEVGNGNTVCGRNEIYSSCVIPCNNCEEKGDCEFIACHKGCDCKKGYYRNKKGRCIPESKCPKPACGRNEVYSTCVNPCNNCEIKGNCQFLVCNKGCDCKTGYYRNEQNECIPEYKCPNTNTCPKLFCARGCHLDSTAKPCPRCVCPKRPNYGGYKTNDEYMEDYYSETTYEESVDEQSEYDSYTIEKRSVDYTETNEMSEQTREHSSNTGDTEENCDTESEDEGSRSRKTKESGYSKSHSGSETNENTYVEEYQESFSGSETGETTYIEELEESHSGWKTGENTSVEEEGSEEDSQSDD